MINQRACVWDKPMIHSPSERNPQLKAKIWPPPRPKAETVEITPSQKLRPGCLALVIGRDLGPQSLLLRPRHPISAYGWDQGPLFRLSAPFFKPCESTIYCNRVTTYGMPGVQSKNMLKYKVCGLKREKNHLSLSLVLTTLNDLHIYGSITKLHIHEVKGPHHEIYSDRDNMTTKIKSNTPIESTLTPLNLVQYTIGLRTIMHNHHPRNTHNESIFSGSMTKLISNSPQSAPSHQERIQGFHDWSPLLRKGLTALHPTTCSMVLNKGGDS